MTASYCGLVRAGALHAIHTGFHDLEHGRMPQDDNGLFERLALEINQAGLSWEIVLKKREGFRAAYAGFDVARVAAFGPEDVTRLMQDAGIVRNRLKVAAIIGNAGRILGLQSTHGSFAAWLLAQECRSKNEWVRLFKNTFRFTGGEITNEFVMGVGLLPGAHDADCPVGQGLKKRLAKKPA